MKHHIVMWATLCMVTICLSSATAMVIITPSAANTAYGSSYFPMGNGLDDQPTWIGGISEPTNSGVFAGSDAPYYQDRWGYFDFGADFADISLYEGWTRYRAWSGGTGCGYQEAYWTDTDPAVWPGAVNTKPADAIDDATLNFNNNVVPNQGDRLWMQSFTYAGGYTLERRYLVMHFADDFTGLTNNRAEEYAFVGEIIPEPTTLVILLGAMVFAPWRRIRG